jgi:hypothetical protein
MKLERVLPVFAAAFAVIYLLAVEQNWALFTYHPKLGAWGWLVEPARTGPPMYWYGWLVTSTLGATSVSLLSWPLVRRWPAQFWLGWVVPLAAIFFFFYFFRDFFLR